jgi:hypothetical protein
MHTQKSPMPETPATRDADAMRAALEHAEKHLARCAAGAHEARDAWTTAEIRCQTNARNEHGGRVTPQDVDRLWRVYQGERDGRERALAVVLDVRDRLGALEDDEHRAPRSAPAAGEGGHGDGHDMPSNGADEMIVTLTRGEVARMAELIGERCDRLHAARVALPEFAEGRAAGLLGSLEFWQDVERRLKAAERLGVEVKTCEPEQLRHLNQIVHQIATASRNNTRPPSERLRTIHELCRDAAGIVRVMRAAPAAGEDEDDARGPISDDERSNGPRRS